MTNSSIWTREQIESAKSSGDLIIIYKGLVYNLTRWALYHPGGILALQHLNGKDATDAMIAFHPKWVIVQKLPTFYVGRLVDYSTSKPSKDYLELEEYLQKEGYFKTDYSFYIREGIKAIILWGLMIFLVLREGDHVSWISSIVSCLCGALLWHQGAFVVHDAGHNGITHNRIWDNAIGVFLADLIGGLSVGWWKDNHYVHHIVTNDPEHDPDIQYLPFFAVSTRFFDSLYSSYYKSKVDFDFASRLFLRFQHLYYYLVLAFGRFNLYALSWSHLAKKEGVKFRSFEIVSIVIFWCWYVWLLSHLPNWQMIATYIFVGHMATCLLHVQITLSHFGMPTDAYPEDEEFAVKGLRTTMNVDCPWWLDWLHGGLQFQIEHHLFPRLPRHNLRKVRPLVREYAKNNLLQYNEYSFTEGNRIVLQLLRSVALQVPSPFSDVTKTVSGKKE